MQHNGFFMRLVFAVAVLSVSELVIGALLLLIVCALLLRVVGALLLLVLRVLLAVGTLLLRIVVVVVLHNLSPFLIIISDRMTQLV